MMSDRRDELHFKGTQCDGCGRLHPKETLDEDDSLAQIVLHELCHALVEGPESLTKEDWGLAGCGARDQSPEARHVESDEARDEECGHQG